MTQNQPKNKRVTWRARCKTVIVIAMILITLICLTIITVNLTDHNQVEVSVLLEVGGIGLACVTSLGAALSVIVHAEFKYKDTDKNADIAVLNKRIDDLLTIIIEDKNKPKK